MKSLDIVFVSSEVEPFAKTGGLADVSASLPQALASFGHNLYLFLPLYRQTQERDYPLHDEGLRLHLELGNKSIAYSIYRLHYKNVIVYFIKQNEYFYREHLYGPASGEYQDNALRFAFFCKAVLKSIQYLQLKPAIIHCNDWQTALIPLYLKELPEFKEAFSRFGSVFTIHNLLYQGIFPKQALYSIGLDERFFHPESLEFYGNINFMKAGLCYADILTTVSKTYAREIQSPAYGAKLDGLIRKRNKDLYGIINGVDYSQWNPGKDSFIKAHYDRKNLKGKKLCKQDLLKQFGLSGTERTLVFGNISRLVANKGIDFIIQLIPHIAQGNQRFVILGYGEPHYQQALESLKKQYPEYVGVQIGFNEQLAHKIEAGSDIFLMPSLYEPSGLNQLYSLKYGTIPIVGAVGGLKDTVIDYRRDKKKGNGFKFSPLNFEAFLEAVSSARLLYKKPVVWRQLMLQAMNCDFSWERSAKQYLKVYKKVLKSKGIYTEGD